MESRNGEINKFSLRPVRGTDADTLFPMIHRQPVTDTILWIGEPFQGRGLGTFAVKELVKYGFQMPKIQKIEAGIFVGDIASRRVFEKNGFRLEGTLRLKVEKGGKWLDEWPLGLVRSDHESQSSR